MSPNIIKLHLTVGCLGFIIFALTGQYMLHMLDMANLEDGERMLIRSAHLYIMLTSAINICIGVYAKVKPASKLQVLVSIVIAFSPLLMLLEFFFGASDVNAERPFAYIGLIAVFAVFSYSVFEKLVLPRLIKNKQ